MAAVSFFAKELVRKLLKVDKQKRYSEQLEIAPKKRPTINDQLSTIFSKFAHLKKISIPC